MSNERILLGRFLKSRAQHPDTPDDPFMHDGQVDPKVDPLEILIDDDVSMIFPSRPPAEPIKIGDLHLSHSPADIYKIKDPPLSHPPLDPVNIGDIPLVHPPFGPVDISDPSVAHPPASPMDIGGIPLAAPPASPMAIGELPFSHPPGDPVDVAEFPISHSPADAVITAEPIPASPPSDYTSVGEFGDAHEPSAPINVSINEYSNDEIPVLETEFGGNHEGAPPEEITVPEYTPASQQDVNFSGVMFHIPAEPTVEENVSNRIQSPLPLQPPEFPQYVDEQGKIQISFGSSAGENPVDTRNRAISYDEPGSLHAESRILAMNIDPSKDILRPGQPGEESRLDKTRLNPLYERKDTVLTDTHPHTTNSDIQKGMYPGTYGSRLAVVDKNMKRLFTEIIDGDSLLDPTVGPYVGSFAKSLGLSPGQQSLNPKLYLSSIVRLYNALGASGLALFAAKQLGLFLLNKHGKIWNPLLINPPPVLNNFIAPAIDIMLGGTPSLITGYYDGNPQGLINSKPGFYEGNVLEGVNTSDPSGDRHIQWAKGNYNEVTVLHYPPFLSTQKMAGSQSPLNIANFAPMRQVGARSQDSSLVDDPTAVPMELGESASSAVFSVGGGQNLASTSVTSQIGIALKTRNIYTEGSPYEENARTSLSDFARVIKGAGIPNNSDLLEESGLKTDSGLSISKFTKDSIGKLFKHPSFALNKSEFRPLERSSNQLFDFSGADDPLVVAVFPKGIVPAGFKKETNGFLEHDIGVLPSDERKGIDDDDTYVPLSFTDLRPFNGTKLRTVYFRPFITNLSEEISPDYNKTSYLGRVDPVVTYASTTRTISLAFKLVAFAPEDLEVIYKKLNWLASMVYPEYDENMLLKSGPVVRMRIGNLVMSADKGLSGVIESSGFNYSESPWEVEKNAKVPKHVEVNLTFLVLHDLPIGRGITGEFGGFGSIDQTTGKWISGDNEGNMNTFRNFGVI